MEDMRDLHEFRMQRLFVMIACLWIQLKVLKVGIKSKIEICVLLSICIDIQTIR